jgi:hypothetical protein
MITAWTSMTSTESQEVDVFPSEVDTLPEAGGRESVLATDNAPQVESLGEGWVTLAEAAELLGESASTLRRKVRSGAVPGVLAFDSKIGRTRWMVDISDMALHSGIRDGSEVMDPKETGGVSEVAAVTEIGSVAELVDAAGKEDEVDPRHRKADSAALVPMEVVDRLEETWAQLRDAVARAEVAERKAEFEKQQRQEVEMERDRLRALLEAVNELAERVFELETHRRQELEQERDRLRALLETEQPQETWWRKLFE